MQINRLFEIIYILLEKKSITAGELAKNFEVSSRTIYRDIETLSSAGIPIYMSKGKGGGISLLPDFVLNKTVLTKEEKTEILTSLKAVNSVNLSETDTALKKLSSLFGEVNTNWIEVDFTSWVNAEDERKIFNTLKSGIIGKQVVTFTYSSGKGENTSREVEPLKLCFKGQAWYLYGYCREREDFRFFKLRRIKDLNILEEDFIPAMPQQVFNEKKVFNEDNLITLTLKLSKEMAFRVYDEFKDFDKQLDGSFIVKVIIPRGPWIFNYITSFGEDCEILEPEDIRLEIKNKLQKALDNYLP